MMELEEMKAKRKLKHKTGFSGEGEGYDCGIMMSQSRWRLTEEKPERKSDYKTWISDYIQSSCN